MSENGKINAFINKIKRHATIDAGKCYMNGCDEKVISSHSIAKSRTLRKLSTGGHVLYFDTTIKDTVDLSLKRTGINNVSVFNGFCSKHDNKIFNPIDDYEYSYGNNLQEFLFAMRAAAREYNAKQIKVNVFHHLDSLQPSDLRSELGRLGISNSFLNSDMTHGTLVAAERGLKDLERVRQILLTSYKKNNYWKVRTIKLTFNSEYPISACSSFAIDYDLDGVLINNIYDYSRDLKSLFLNIFPQDGKTYILISFLHRDQPAFQSLKKVLSMNELEQKVFVSNLLANFVENFAVSEAYWDSLPTVLKKTFSYLWGASLGDDRIRLISEKSMNIFI